MPANFDKYANQYFTGVQASLFVGDIWCDEVVGIQFSAQQSIIPLFGYASSKFDAVARGKAIIQGYFEVNFIDEGYLYAVLEEAWNRTIKDGEFTSAEEARRTKIDALSEQIKLLNAISEAPEPTTSTRNDAGQTATYAGIIDSLSDLTISEAQEVKQKVFSRRAPYENIIYQATPFRLIGYFGNPEYYGTEQGAYKQINDCFLIGNEMIVASDDSPIRERYSFLARSHI